MRQVYDLLEDDGILVFQVAGFRPAWQYEDLIWSVNHARSAVQSQSWCLMHLITGDSS